MPGLSAVCDGAGAYRGNRGEKQGEDEESHEEIVADGLRGIEIAFKTMPLSDLHNRNRREAE
jgi:hypothetical protein